MILLNGNIVKTIDAVLKLKKSNLYYRVEQTKNSKYLNNFKILKNTIAIVVGNEVNGVSEEVLSECDEVIEIPQFGTKHSLNVSVSTGIVIWELWKKLKRK